MTPRTSPALDDDRIRSVAVYLKTGHRAEEVREALARGSARESRDLFNESLAGAGSLKFSTKPSRSLCPAGHLDLRGRDRNLFCPDDFNRERERARDSAPVGASAGKSGRLLLPNAMLGLLGRRWA